MKPHSRAELRTYCLRKLGSPVVEINIDDDQIEDRIDESIARFQEFHHDAIEKAYTALPVTLGDQSNGYFSMANTCVAVVRVFPLSSAGSVNSTAGGFNMFDINYQIRLNELYNYVQGDYVYFELANQHIRTLEMLFTGDLPIRYNKHVNKLYIDTDWNNTLPVGFYVIAEVYKTLDSDVDFWGNEWFKKYTTACIKEQWGTNLKKFDGVRLPGGIALNGQRIYDEAVAEKAQLELEERDAFETPPEFFVG